MPRMISDGYDGFREATPTRERFYAKLENAIELLEEADENWATLSALERFAVTRLAVRVCAALASLELGR